MPRIAGQFGNPWEGSVSYTHLESMLPPGRRQEVWRVVCACGQTSQQWSVSQGAAIRAWNRNLAQENDLASLSKERMTPQSHLKS